MTSLHGRRCGLAGSISIGLRPGDVRHPSFAGLVVLAGSPYPIPSRTRPLNFPALMVLSLKTWKSRSLPGLPRTEASLRSDLFAAVAGSPAAVFCCGMGTAVPGARDPPRSCRSHRGDAVHLH